MSTGRTHTQARTDEHTQHYTRGYLLLLHVHLQLYMIHRKKGLRKEESRCTHFYVMVIYICT